MCIMEIFYYVPITAVSYEESIPNLGFLVFPNFAGKVSDN